MKRHLPFLLAALFLLLTRPLAAQITCQTGGNLWVYTNYDGGTININVDVNQPNIKIGICTYEPVTINISGPFAANVTEVRYAGYVSTNNFHCSGSATTTTINGAGSAATSINFLPPATLSNPNGYSSIVCGYTCSTTSNQGGCNTADQIKDYFQASMGATLVSYDAQYGCWSASSPYSLSAGGNCCSSTTSCLIAANAGPDIIVCQGSGVQLNGSAVGGATTYSWSPSTGLSNPNIANPIASPTATTTYVLTATDGGVCADTDTITVTVPSTSVSFTPLPGVCQGSGAVALGGATPSGGTWTGSGVLNNTFDPGPSGVGTFTLGYTAVDGNGCSVTGSTTIEVFALPSVSFSLSGTYCTSDPGFALVSGTPAGGVYAGPGVANGQFFPGVAGPGLHTIQYAYTDANGCSDTVSGQVTVSQTPATPTISVGGTDSLYSSTVGTSYTWLLNGVVIATTTTQPYVATQNGSYAVIVTNGIFCNSDTSASVLVEITAITLPGGQVIHVWPNPAQDYVRLSAGDLSLEVALYDLSGKLVRAPRVIPADGTLSLLDLSKGVYLLQVRHEGRVGTMRIVKE
jgi:Secretion system C-terminal sorting domain